MHGRPPPVPLVPPVALPLAPPVTVPPVLVVPAAAPVPPVATMPPLPASESESADVLADCPPHPTTTPNANANVTRLRISGVLHRATKRRLSPTGSLARRRVYRPTSRSSSRA